MKGPTRIVFYDGHCGLCDGVVRWLLRHDPEGRLLYAPLGGATARRLLTDLPDDLDAIVYWREGKPAIHTSDAVGTILADLPRPWAWLSVMLWVPRGLRDWVYKVLSRRRYRLFGRFQSCPVPDIAVRQRFLP